MHRDGNDAAKRLNPHARGLLALLLATTPAHAADTTASLANRNLADNALAALPEQAELRRQTNDRAVSSLSDNILDETNHPTRKLNLQDALLDVPLAPRLDGRRLTDEALQDMPLDVAPRDVMLAIAPETALPRPKPKSLAAILAGLTRAPVPNNPSPRLDGQKLADGALAGISGE